MTRTVVNLVSDQAIPTLTDTLKTSDGRMNTSRLTAVLTV